MAKHCNKVKRQVKLEETLFWPTSQTKGWVSNVLRILKNWSNKGPETQLEIRKKIWTDNPHMQNKNKIKKSLKQRQYVQN